MRVSLWSRSRRPTSPLRFELVTGAFQSPALRALLISFALITSGCFKGWDLGGPWSCSDGGTCPEGFSCDEGVCCVEGSTTATNACPTLPYRGKCLDGGDPTDYFQDLDRDGQGNQNVFVPRCRQPRDPQWVLSAEDCDDTRAEVNRSTLELCDGLDNNCDGVIDDGLANNSLFYRDEDGDTFGLITQDVFACVAPPGYVAQSGDCDDLSPGRFPGAPELCNNVNDNCDMADDLPGMNAADTDPVNATVINFPCLAPSAFGICQAGSFQCLADPQNPGKVRRTCVSLRDAGLEVCDGLDNDCDNSVDERPACGGPVNLFNQPELTYRGRRLPPSSNAQLVAGCQAMRTEPGGATETPTSGGRVWTGGTSIADNEYYHVWSVETPADKPWDLSRLDATLKLAFDVTFAPYTGGADGGVWGIAGTGPGGSGFYPVVYLCGEFDHQYIRYRITEAAIADALDRDKPSFDVTLPLNAAEGSKWLVATGSGFDTSRVRRIEVVLFTRSSNFTLTFRPDVGLP
ncbi:MAG: putative metal-binding motif-containing protein [Archangium sp.]